MRRGILANIKQGVIIIQIKDTPYFWTVLVFQPNLASNDVERDIYS